MNFIYEIDTIFTYENDCNYYNKNKYKQKILFKIVKDNVL